MFLVTVFTGTVSIDPLILIMVLVEVTISTTVSHYDKPIVTFTYYIMVVVVGRFLIVLTGFTIGLILSKNSKGIVIHADQVLVFVAVLTHSPANG